MVCKLGLKPWVILGVAVLPFLGARAEAAPHNVYYRAGADNPWVFYAGAATNAKAADIVTDLKSLGYAAEVLTADTPPPAATAGSTYVSGTTYVPPYGSPYLAGTTYPRPYGASNWAGSYSVSYGGTGFSRNADHWYHYNHYHHPAGYNPRPHPTPHPYYRVGHPGGHHIRHHGAIPVVITATITLTATATAMAMVDAKADPTRRSLVPVASYSPEALDTRTSGGHRELGSPSAWPHDHGPAINRLARTLGRIA
jgi:hypothetical protein